MNDIESKSQSVGNGNAARSTEWQSRRFETEAVPRSGAWG